MISGIYIISNTENSKIYIGSTHNFKVRWKKHKSLLNKNKHHSKHLQNAWNKYGESVFDFQVFEYVCLDQLIAREQVWLDFFKPFKTQGYNICPTAGNSQGYTHSKETITKITNSVKETNYKHSDKTRKRMSDIMYVKKAKGGIPNNIRVMSLKNSDDTLSNREIARRLGVSPTCVNNIIKKSV